MPSRTPAGVSRSRSMSQSSSPQSSRSTRTIESQHAAPQTKVRSLSRRRKPARFLRMDVGTMIISRPRLAFAGTQSSAPANVHGDQSTQIRKLSQQPFRADQAEEHQDRQ